MKTWREVRDSRVERPDELDTTSSAAIVYERRNIRQETVVAEDGDTPPAPVWAYEQQEYTREEWAALNAPATQAVMQAVSGLELSLMMMSLDM